MIARRVAGILPPLAFDEALEVTAVHSVAGMLATDSGLLRRPPLQALHHTATVVSLVGGGSGLARPGAISLAHHGVVFNALFTITNMPISRFAAWLRRAGTYESYMARLESAFNPATVPGLMCRSLVSVGYDGRLHDCDFNQMLEMGLGEGQPATIFDFDLARLSGRSVRTGDHCFGCTAGAGSSCGGAIA